MQRKVKVELLTDSNLLMEWALTLAAFGVEIGEAVGETSVMADITAVGVEDTEG